MDGAWRWPKITLKNWTRGRTNTWTVSVSETQRMGTLIDDLLQLSRVSRARIEPGTVDLSRVAEVVDGKLREALPDRRIEFLIRPGLTVSGDARLLEVVLTNLLENAAKFTGTRASARDRVRSSRTKRRRHVLRSRQRRGFRHGLPH